MAFLDPTAADSDSPLDSDVKKGESRRHGFMHAMVFRKYDPILRNVTLSIRPFPRITSPHDLIIRVVASSINPVDWKQAQGSMSTYVRLTLPKILGMDFSGEVVKEHSQAKFFPKGSIVYGRLSRPFVEEGTHADFVKVRSDRDHISFKPDWLTHPQAASIGVAWHTAWECLIDNIGIDPNDKKENKEHKILIIGCSGGVGIAASQLCRSFEVGEVWGVCSGKNRSFMEENFGIRVIDYERGPLAKILRESKHYFTGILDCVGGEVYYQLAANEPFVLHPAGTFVTIVGQAESGNKGVLGDLEILLRTANKKISGSVRYRLFMGLTKPETWTQLVQHIEKHKIRPFVGLKLLMHDALAGYQLSFSRRTRGKIVLLSNALREEATVREHVGSTVL
jgi:NADPH:quinone reductase-like Zn-dependent oxidoreductase